MDVLLFCHSEHSEESLFNTFESIFFDKLRITEQNDSL